MISAKVIADTVWDNKRIISLQLHLPKFILAELNTHRLIARCSASSRAIPTDKIIKMLDEDYFSPIYWGKNKAGMEANEALSLKEEQQAKLIWRKSFENAVKSVKELQLLGVHKQTINRLLEPFMWVDTICTATEWDNFFNLRISEHAQPEMRALAEAMKDAMDNSTPVARMWHLPYVRKEEQRKDLVDFKISAARCARVSYLKHDQTKPNYAEDLALADKLLSQKHCFTPNHEVLTNKGWVKFENLIGDELIAGFDTSTGLFKGYEKPIEIINKDYQGKIYSWNNNDIEVSFTDQHKLLGVLIRRQTDRKKSYESLEIINPSRIEYSARQQLERTNGEREMIMFSAGKAPQINNQNLYHKGQLIGFFIGDGFKGWSKNVIQFRLKRERKIEYLTNLIKNLNLEFRLRVDKQGVYNFYIYKSFIRGLDFYNEENRKCLPSTNYSIDELLGIFDGLKNSDGSIKRNTWVYATMSKQLVEQIKCLVPLVGLTAREHKQTKTGCYKIGFTTNNHIRLNDSRTKTSKVSIKDYYGKVYCVEIPSNGIMVRKNGKTLLTHNCSPFDLSAIHKECVSPKYQKETRQFKNWIPFRVYLEKGMPNDFLRGEKC